MPKSRKADVRALRYVPAPHRRPKFSARVETCKKLDCPNKLSSCHRKTAFLCKMGVVYSKMSEN
jgi:hypothetical protein